MTTVIPNTQADSHDAAIPAQSEKIQDILQDVWKKYRTSEAYFAATLVRHYIVSRQYSKSSDVGIYRAGTLDPEIIVTLFTQNCTFHTVIIIIIIILYYAIYGSTHKYN